MTKNIANSWKSIYSNAPKQLNKLSEIEGVASVFNANIDAVLKVNAKKFSSWIESLGSDSTYDQNRPKRISSTEDFIRGFFDSFSRGIAQEWLIDNTETYQWLQDKVGYDKLQMGSQGGIIANVLSICDIQKVYVHSASNPKEQAELFNKSPNLLCTNSLGELVPAHKAIRENDNPLIHWILEFDKGETIEHQGKKYTCPKSNRFIATYDPLNFELHIDPSFAKQLNKEENLLDMVFISGYQFLTKTLPSGKKGIQRVAECWDVIEKWKISHPSVLLHFEFASTQDIIIRKALLENIATKVDSVGCNEQELIDMLNIIGEENLAQKCKENLSSVDLYEGLLVIFKRLSIPRIQLHMFGLYITLQNNSSTISAESNRSGMAFAATCAASKAGTGKLEAKDHLLWSHGKEVSEISIQELTNLANHLNKKNEINNFELSGMATVKDIQIIAVPTILIEKPVTLVGMGDTISSLSLVAAR